MTGLLFREQVIGCPLERVLLTLVGKDWTRYEGLLHTDHAVREEFFIERSSAPTSSKPYLMDFTYLYDPKQGNFEEFSLGKCFSADEIYEEIGRPEDWTHRASTSEAARSEEQAAQVAEQLFVCQGWELRNGYIVDDGE